jgi:hypothetical protein
LNEEEEETITCLFICPLSIWRAGSHEILLPRKH